MIDTLSYKFSVCRVIAVAGVSFLFGGVLGCSGDIGALVHIPTLAIILGLCFFMLLGSYGIDFLKFIPASLQSLVCKPSRPDARYAEIAKFGSRYVIAGAVICGLMGTMRLLVNLSDPSRLGQGTAMLMLPAFYAILVSELFFAFVYLAFSSSSSNSQPHASDVALQEGANDE